MIGWLQRRRARRMAGRAWHAAILARSRAPDLYAGAIVPDTLDGRFHMLALVSALVLRQLREDGAEGRAVADRVYRDVFSGLDHALREEGVSDSTIARKMRARGETFFGLARALDGALAPDAPDDALADVLRRNGVTSTPTATQALCDWLRAQAGTLSAAPRAARLAGTVEWTKV